MPKKVPIAVDDLRLFLKVRLAVVPRQWFNGLWKPGTPALERDKTRDDLVGFITEGWDGYEITTVETSVFEPSSRERL